MLRIIRATDFINLFHLIVDPEDFGRSVENLFHLSCLFNDGMCGFHINEDGEPVVGVLLLHKTIPHSNDRKRLNLRTLIDKLKGMSNIVKLFLNLTWPLGGFMFVSPQSPTLLIRVP
jgi:hypothetical protein